MAGGTGLRGILLCGLGVQLRHVRVLRGDVGMTAHTTICHRINSPRRGMTCRTLGRSRMSTHATGRLTRFGIQVSRRGFLTAAGEHNAGDRKRSDECGENPGTCEIPTPVVSHDVHLLT
jgi:hypothetical protein